MSKSTSSKQIETLHERIGKLNQRLERLQQVEREKERELDTRRKVLLGVYLLQLVKDGNGDAREMVKLVIARVPKRSAKPFDGWKP